MTHRFPGIRFILFLTVLSLPMAAFAADPVGKASGGGNSIEWFATASGYDRVMLTVSGPDGEIYSKEFPSGRAMSFRIQDLGTNVLDGQYNYELRVVPKISAAISKQLANARAANDDKAAKKIMRDAGLDVNVVQSGTFTVQNGWIVSPDLQESGASGLGGGITSNITNGGGKVAVNDQVIPDDLIVQGSACVGLDCVNNESFGFDTIRLKENNTRIKFDDTSSSAGFPANDWQLTANDSASGGSSKFSIEDITGSKVPFTVTAGAATNSIFADSTGRIGFRTSTPVLDLHVNTSNTPALRLEQNNSGGFTAQTWDVAGNEANFFVRDVTGGSRLPFRIRPGATTSSVDISADGDVGINTASPNANTKLDVFDSTQNKARIALTGQEFYQAGNTSTDGVAIILGVNRLNNRQIWFGDTAQLTQNSTNPLIRFYPYNGEISAIATDGSTPKDLKLNASGGNVGIGTSSPASKLHVNGGDVRVTGGSFIDDGVTLTAPDYVFDDSYKLLALDDVRKFIEENKHLPNVPSAKEIKASGLNMSQFQMRLLEKVEELTLYTLDQHDQIQSLKAQNQELLKRMEQLQGTQK